MYSYVTVRNVAEKWNMSVCLIIQSDNKAAKLLDFHTRDRAIYLRNYIMIDGRFLYCFSINENIIWPNTLGLWIHPSLIQS